MAPIDAGPDVLVQPILLAKGGTHLETILSAARASLAAYLRPHYAGVSPAPTWQPWLDGSFTKSARRAPRSHLDKALQWAIETGQAAAGQQIDDGAAVATSPLPYTAMPKVLAKAQVSGTNMPQDSAGLPANGGPTLHLLRTLTTGKVAAQAAHALWLWALPQLAEEPAGSLADWFEAGMPAGLLLTGNEQLADLAMDSAAVVRDAGLTEVAPGTITATITNPNV